MDAFSNYLEKLGSNFLVSAMVPSLALVIASILVFDPILDVAKVFTDPVNTYQLISFGTLVLIFTVTIGFTLTALNTYVLKIFEGYVVFPPIHFIYNKTLKIHQQRALQMRVKRDSLEREFRLLEQHLGHNRGLETKLEELKDQYYKAASDYDQAYPDNPDEVLPTQFGNTLKAAEN